MIIELTDLLKLVNLANDLRLESEDLDELVHDTANAGASNINNQGVEGQLKFLVEELGYEATVNELRDLV